MCGGSHKLLSNPQATYHQGRSNRILGKKVVVCIWLLTCFLVGIDILVRLTLSTPTVSSSSMFRAISTVVWFITTLAQLGLRGLFMYVSQLMCERIKHAPVLLCASHSCEPAPHLDFMGKFALSVVCRRGWSDDQLGWARVNRDRRASYPLPT